MAKWAVTFYDTKELAEAALELLDNTDYAAISPYMVDGVEKWMLINAGTGLPVAITSGTAPSHTMSRAITRSRITLSVLKGIHRHPTR